ncbi:MAG: acyloxyacyl hydrolase [Bacteroides sp.]|nr:acyloxyacyl hydrolase [Bacteroides sp.]
MNSTLRTGRIVLLLTALFFPSTYIQVQDNYIHRLGIEGRPGYIFPTSSFLRGENGLHRYLQSAYSAHLKYSFQVAPGTAADKVYGGAYQGIGLGYFDFGDHREMGTPIALYLFQGARIAEFTPRLSLNYEWGFGVSFGWKPYNSWTNPNNTVIGTKANAYLNAGVYLNWVFSPSFDLNVGASAMHFSNGNTKFPNTGLNTIDFKIGVVYNFNRNLDVFKELLHPAYDVPPFPRHVNYDLTLFGSWRRKAVNVPGGQVPAPGKYGVAGFNFAPMYNLGYKFRAGVSLDGVYDASANVYAKNYISSDDDDGFGTPPLRKQLSLGVSARGELVMPYFTVDIGFGANILHGGNDLQSFYQILALKIDTGHDTYLHIGYNLKDFHEPNYLMLGVGYRFNNRRPRLYR